MKKFMSKLQSILLLFVVCFPLLAMANSAETVNNLLDPHQHTISTVIGNPKGDVTVVEFMDYNCHYCKLMVPVMEKLIKEDPNLRVVMIDLPVLTASSDKAALIALAANEQGKYFEMHQALMKQKGDFSDAAIKHLSDKLGLDSDKLIAGMKSDEMIKQLAYNKKLGDELEVPGTPAIIIGRSKSHDSSTTAPEPFISFGFLDTEQMQEQINKFRVKN